MGQVSLCWYTLYETLLVGKCHADISSTHRYASFMWWLFSRKCSGRTWEYESRTYNHILYIWIISSYKMLPKIKAFAANFVKQVIQSLLWKTKVFYHTFFWEIPGNCFDLSHSQLAASNLPGSGQATSVICHMCTLRRMHWPRWKQSRSSAGQVINISHWVTNSVSRTEAPCQMIMVMTFTILTWWSLST